VHFRGGKQSLGGRRRCHELASGQPAYISECAHQLEAPCLVQRQQRQQQGLGGSLLLLLLLLLVVLMQSAVKPLSADPLASMLSWWGLLLGQQQTRNSPQQKWVKPLSADPLASRPTCKHAVLVGVTAHRPCVSPCLRGMQAAAECIECRKLGNNLNC
jgi:hypothetical protein